MNKIWVDKMNNYLIDRVIHKFENLNYYLFLNVEKLLFIDGDGFRDNMVDTFSLVCEYHDPLP